MAVTRHVLHRSRRRDTTYRRVLVPVDGSAECEHCLHEACLLVADGGVVLVVAAVVVPLQLPLETPLPHEERDARETLQRARSLADTYEVGVRTQTIRGRSRGESILAHAAEAGADAIVVPMHRGQRLDGTAELVLRRATCRVLVVAL